LIGIGIERKRLHFGHEQLDVYRAAIEYVGWAFRHCELLQAQRNANDQPLRASQAIPLNIAEGNGKATEADRKRFFEIARGSALECTAIQDVLEVCGALSAAENAEAKKLLDRIVAMLTRLGGCGYSGRTAGIWHRRFRSRFRFRSRNWQDHRLARLRGYEISIS
jgi:four helix bundle protein